ncbi:unnamed protein product [Ceutorhynchus assimilis]|uniref:FAD synthase n=1 Tax=Ceutorhynchus assimilis TaxID=467358 RepID=A0A9N9MFI8_9CUCU|nr:unnamed protein product [Ceutorhynchus assimilis]
MKSATIIASQSSFLKGKVDQIQMQNLQKIVDFLDNIEYEVLRLAIVDETDKAVACELNISIKLADIVIVLLNPKTQCFNRALADVTQQQLDLGTLWPKSARLLKQTLVHLQRIFVIAPDSIEEHLSVLKEYLLHYKQEPLYEKNFYLILNELKTEIESLPQENFNVQLKKTLVGNQEVDVVTLSAKELKNIVAGEVLLKNLLKSQIMQSEWQDFMGKFIYDSEEQHLIKSIKIIEKCLEDYGPDNVFLSFNGGKDCTVLLHLVQTVLRKNYPNRKEKLFCLYVRSPNVFEEQDAFIEQCMIFYDLEILSITGNIKEALRITIEQKPHLKACFMGTRRTDPFCSNLNEFQMTDPDWPEIMRCSPFLDWHYSDIWDYLLYYKVPYCQLYDLGFTSLGNATNTIRNPSLLVSQEEQEIYLPAYKLLNEQQERSGRNISKI